MRPSLAATFKLIPLALACAVSTALAQEPETTAAPAAPAAVAATVPEGAVTFSAPVAITGETIIPITLEDAVQLAAANNLGLRIESFNRDSAREAVIVADAGFEPVFAVNVATSESQSQLTGSSTASTASSLTNGSASISQRVDTGATVSLNTRLNRNERVGGDATAAIVFGSDVSLSVRQPLLAGAGFAVNRANRDRARIGIERSETTFKGRALDIIRDTELAFFDLASAHYTLDVQRSGLATAEQFMRENEARRSLGSATELDVMQASVSVANRRALIISAEQRVRDATDRLLVLFGRREFSGILQPVGYVFAPPSDLTVERSYGRAAENDTDVANARGLLRQLELDAMTARNQKLPGLDLTGAFGLGGTDFDALGNAIDKIPEGDTYNWQVGIALNFPWGMNEARARSRAAGYGVSQQQIRLEQLEQTLMFNVRTAVRSVQSDRQTVEINALATDLSKREFELEKAKFDSGLSTSRLVVEAQQRWDEAKVRETQSRVQLRQNMARLRRYEGGSLDLYGIVPLTQR